MYMLGMSNLHEDENQALSWFKKAAALGHAGARAQADSIVYARTMKDQPPPQVATPVSSFKPCPDCGGKGFIHSFRRGGGQFNPDYDRYDPCPRCHGTGHIPN